MPKMTKSTEKVLVEAIEMVQQACLRKEVLHLNYAFTGDPIMPGVVACFVVCPSDDLTDQLKVEIDKVVHNFLEVNGFKKQAHA